MIIINRFFHFKGFKIFFQTWWVLSTPTGPYQALNPNWMITEQQSEGGRQLSPFPSILDSVTPASVWSQGDDERPPGWLHVVVDEHAGKEDDESLQGWLHVATLPAAFFLFFTHSSAGKGDDEQWAINQKDVRAADWRYEMISDPDQLTEQ